MKFYHYVLLVVAVLFASFGPASASRNSKLTVPGIPTHVRESNTPTKRFLRYYTTNEEEDQERGISLKKITGLQNISNILKQRKVLKRKSVKDAFEALKLSNMRITDDKNFLVKSQVIDFFSSSDFKVWSKHAAKVNKKDPDMAMLTALTEIYDEKRVVKMIIMSTDSQRAGEVAKKLETAQFKMWNTAGKQPHDIVTLVGMSPLMVEAYPQLKQFLVRYTERFSPKKILDN